MQYKDVYSFWFEQCSPNQWFKKDAGFDRALRKRFTQTHEMAVNGELSHWRSEPKGALSEILVLDQLSRNMFRDTPKAFASDNLALCLAQHAVEKGFDKQLDDTERGFLYMPYMHSESAVIHQHAERLFRGLKNYNYELAHKKIIDRFGRYPHRNEILGRESSEEELLFLQQPGSSF